jgi:hypothetical protein
MEKENNLWSLLVAKPVESHAISIGNILNIVLHVQLFCLSQD